MGLFTRKNQFLAIACPVAGKTVTMKRVPDPTFSEEILGKGVAIRPTIGQVVAPFDGVVDMIFDTAHAVNLVSEKGTELLIHVGIDTVTLKGKYFTPHVQNGAKVSKGDLLLEFDMKGIESEGYTLITPVVVCNGQDYKEILPVEDIEVQPGDTIIKLAK